MANVKFVKTSTSKIVKMVDAKNNQRVYGFFFWNPDSGVWVADTCNKAFDYHINECEDFYDAFYDIDDVKAMAMQDRFRFIPA